MVNGRTQDQIFEQKGECIAWSNCSDDHIEAFQKRLSQYLTASDSMTNKCPNGISDYMVAAIHNCADECLPKHNINRQTKPYRSPDLKSAHAESRRLRRIWISHGRPRGNGNKSYNDHKAAKCIFRRKQRIA